MPQQDKPTAPPEMLFAWEQAPARQAPDSDDPSDPADNNPIDADLANEPEDVLSKLNKAIELSATAEDDDEDDEVDRDTDAGESDEDGADDGDPAKEDEHAGEDDDSDPDLGDEYAEGKPWPKEAKAAFTRKTQELAEVRKAAETSRDEIVQKATAYDAKLQQAEQLLQALKPAEPDWGKLRKENPAEYAARREEIRQAEDNLKRVQEERQRNAENAQSQVLQREHAALVKVMGWKTPETVKAEMDKLFEFAVNDLGFSETDVQAVSDHRVIMLLKDAHELRELRAEKEQAKGKIKDIRNKQKGIKPLKAGTRQRPSEGKTGDKKAASVARARLRESGSVEDATDALIALGF